MGSAASIAQAARLRSGAPSHRCGRGARRAPSCAAAMAAGVGAHRGERVRAGARARAPGRATPPSRRASAPMSRAPQRYPPRARHELARAAAVAHDRRQAARQRFQHGVGQRVVERRQHEGVGGAVERLGVVLRAGERHAIGYAGDARALVARRVPIAPTTKRCAATGTAASASIARPDALARVLGADDQEHACVVGNAEIRANAVAMRLEPG